MKKYITTLLMMFAFVGSAAAQTFQIPQGPTGNVAPQAAIYRDYLNSKGYNIDFKALGNCALAKQNWETTKDKFITIWEAWLMKPPCDIELNDSNFVRTTYQNFQYFCSVPTKNPDLYKTAGATYTVGIAANTPLEPTFEAMNKASNNKATIMWYKASGDVAVAAAAKEIDYIITAAPTKILEEGGKCIWGTAPADLAFKNIPNIATLFPNAPHVIGNIHIVMAKNFTKAELDKLRQDITNAMRTEEFKKYLAARDVVNIVDVPFEEQKRRTTDPKYRQ